MTHAMGDSLPSGGVLPLYSTNHTNSQQNTCTQTARNTNRTPPLPVSTTSVAYSFKLYAVKCWFNGYGMTWDKPINAYLFGLGMGCVEHLKMLELIDIYGMFQNHD